MLNIMSRGRLVWFLFLVTLASGMTMGVTGSVHAQSVSTFQLNGVLTDSDGNPLVGYTVEAPVDGSFLSTTAVTDDQGSYQIVYSSLFGPIISVGDTIEITIKDPDGEVIGTSTYTVTASNISPRFGQATHDFMLSGAGLTVVVEKGELPADGESTSTITVTIEDANGEPVTDSPPTITVVKGTVGEVINNGDGTYTVVYTSPALVIDDPESDTITVDSDAVEETLTADVTLQPVPTVITLSVEPSAFVSGAGATGAISIAVNRGGNAVADAQLSLGVRRAERRCGHGYRHGRDEQRRRHVQRDVYCGGHGGSNQHYRNGLGIGRDCDYVGQGECGRGGVHFSERGADDGFRAAAAP